VLSQFRSSFKSVIRRLFWNRRGSVAIQFALLVMPMAVLGFGLADINRASVHKNQLQNALDAAALIVARSSAANNTQAQSVGAAALAAQLSQVTDGTLTTSTFTVSGSTITASAQMSVVPIISNLWLVGGNMTVGASATINRATGKVEMVLVLDNTGSMADNGKMDALKVAAKGLIDTLAASAAASPTPHTVKIGIVPFANTVKIGTPTLVSTYLSSSWLDTGAQSPIHDDIFTKASGTYNANRFTLFTQMGVSWAGCVEARPSPYDVQDTAPTNSNKSTLIVPYFAPDEPDPPSWMWWASNGNFGTFENNYKNDVTYSTTNWKIPQGVIAKYTLGVSGTNQWGDALGPNWMCNMQPLARLSETWTSLKTEIDAMNPNGATNTHMGMMWGWHVLSPNAPFADGVAYGTAGTTKIAVLMTDGDNNYNDQYSNSNQSNYGAYGYIWQGRLNGLTETSTDAERTTEIDKKLKTTCDNMKAQNIKIYSVGVMVSANAQALLSYCASSSDYYFNVTDPAQLNAAFAQIAGQISNLTIYR